MKKTKKGQKVELVFYRLFFGNCPNAELLLLHKNFKNCSGAVMKKDFLNWNCQVCPFYTKKNWGDETL